jgi:phosphoglycolate phosphatase-like HAD superfamily hydrolase
MHRDATASELIVLDFDRTLCDVSIAIRRLYDIAEHFSIQVDAIQTAQQITQNDGGSFSPLNFIRQHVTKKAYSQFCEHTSITLEQTCSIRTPLACLLTFIKLKCHIRL